MKEKLEHIMGIIMLFVVFAMAVSYNSGIYYVQAAKKTEQKRQDSDKGEENRKKYAYTVVIDAGHGGFDPGKVGINKELEKDINLAIALKLKQELEKENIGVIMTREEDIDLAEEGTGSKKQSDMRNRMERINEADADLCVSIHQNSYSSGKVKGAQTFYYSGSDKGKELAEKIQTSLKEKLNDGNHRLEKSNDSYYILRKSVCPTVIVECGFLSNWEEATSLRDEYYQGKLAEAICEGIRRYLDF